MTSTRNLEHHLLSLPGREGYVHAYVITEGRDGIEPVVNHMFDQAEKSGMTVVLPMILATTLDADNTAKVEGLLKEMSPKAAKLLRKVKKFHYSIWLTSHGSGLDWLVELH
jgi:hypothetical protein